jgi:hypothetical protein
MGRLGWTVLGFFGGGAAVFAIGMALPSVISISQAEGAYAMGVAFFWTPLAAIIGAVVGWVRGGRKA